MTKSNKKLFKTSNIDYYRYHKFAEKTALHKDKLRTTVLLDFPTGISSMQNYQSVVDNFFIYGYKVMEIENGRKSKFSF